MFQACELRQYQEGEIILGAGEVLDRMYVVASGRLMLTQVSEPCCCHAASHVAPNAPPFCLHCLAASRSAHTIPCSASVHGTRAGLQNGGDIHCELLWLTVQWGQALEVQSARQSKNGSRRSRIRAVWLGALGHCQICRLKQLAIQTLQHGLTHCRLMGYGNPMESFARMVHALSHIMTWRGH